MALFGRPIRDHLSLHYLPLLNDKHMTGNTAGKPKYHAFDKHPKGPKQLQPLVIGDAVQIQNQHGTNPTKWNNTVSIATALLNRQYQVIVDGSKRTTLRNRRFLKRIPPACRNIETVADFPTPDLTPPLETPLTDETSESPQHVTGELITNIRVNTLPRESSVDQPKRSTRISRPPRPLSPKMFGQSHDI